MKSSRLHRLPCPAGISCFTKLILSFINKSLYNFKHRDTLAAAVPQEGSPIYTNLLLFTAGLILLYWGSDWLVEGASSMAQSMGLRRIVIGLTVVAFGTSMPELVISVVSSFKGKSMIAVGNVVGSNICNICLVMGLAAVLRPITTRRSVVARDLPIMLGISVLLLLISLNSRIGRLEGILLFCGIFVYTAMNYAMAIKGQRRRDPYPPPDEPVETPAVKGTATRTRQGLLIVSGIAAVAFGAEILVDSAIEIMKFFGVGEKFIGLTVVAFGTSLPELATSGMAAYRKEMDISIGNLVGSNVFNILSVLGAAAIVKPIAIPGGLTGSGLVFDYLVMLFVGFLPWLMMRKTLTLTRRDGAILLFCYLDYLAYLILK